MSRTYRATGINLKSMVLGENDRLLTVLTPEYGLIRVVAPGARKHKSTLRGRSSVFAVNTLFIAKGRNLDRIIQVESLESFSGLSQDLGKLTASQYLAEVALCQALSQQPQNELFALVCNYLRRIEQQPSAMTLPCLVDAVFRLLVLAGLAPQVRLCCVTKQLLIPDFSDTNWRIGFSTAVGGTVSLSELERLARSDRDFSRSRSMSLIPHPPLVEDGYGKGTRTSDFEETDWLTPDSYPLANPTHSTTDYTRSQIDRLPLRRTSQETLPDLYVRLNASELALLQQLADPDLANSDSTSALCRVSQALDSLSDTSNSNDLWLSIERILRHYTQYHLERPIRSAALIETCFSSPCSPPLSKPL